MAHFCDTNEIISITFSKIFDVFSKCIHLRTMCSTPFYCRMYMHYHGTRSGVWFHTAQQVALQSTSVKQVLVMMIVK